MDHPHVSGVVCRMGETMNAKTTKKKIVVIASYAPSLINFRFSLLLALQKQGYDVHTIAPFDDRVAKTLAEKGIQHHGLFLSRQGLNIFGDVKYCWALRRMLKQLQPDQVLAYTAKPVVYGMIAAKMARVPKRFALITGLGSIFIGGGLKITVLRRVLSWQYKAALAFAHGVIFQNNDDQGYFVSKRLVAAKKTRVVNGSGVDMQHFAYEPCLPEKITFLMLARLIRDKGIYEYAAAVQQVKKHHPQVVFQLAGELDHNPSALTADDLAKLVKNSGIEYLGALDDVLPALRDCSVYALPSYREGTPRSVLEAMSVGRPIITTDVPGCRQTVQEGENGFLVPAQNSEQLAKKMQYFIEHPQAINQMGLASRHLVEQKYDVHLVNAAMLSAMES